MILTETQLRRGLIEAAGSLRLRYNPREGTLGSPGETITITGAHPHSGRPFSISHLDHLTIRRHWDDLTK